MLKTHRALSDHLAYLPEQHDRFPNFHSPPRKPYLARGEDRPLEGEIHSAQYFHGRSDSITPPRSLVNHVLSMLVEMVLAELQNVTPSLNYYKTTPTSIHSTILRQRLVQISHSNYCALIPLVV
jgi:hypothetical protein